MISLRLPFLVLLLTASIVSAQDKLRSAERIVAPKKGQPGLALTFSAGGKSDTRTARLIALEVPAGAAVTPFLPAGAFSAKWEGAIVSALRTDYTFVAEVQGAIKVSINGQPLLEGAGDSTMQSVSKSVRLNKGPNAIVAEFASDGKEGALLRLKWQAGDFPLEPVPPTVFTHDASAPAVVEGERLRTGRLLFAQMRCTACHAAPDLLPPRGEGMPELAQDAPVLAELGARFNEPWLAAWISDPHSIRPQARMPRVFTGGKEGEVDQRARDLAAYFVAQGMRDDTAPAAENASLGGALFGNLGCISCHSTPEFQGEDEHRRVPLGHLKAKWQPPALREYLKDPTKYYAWTRMPHFRLNDEEAERLTAFLLSGTQKEFPAGAKGDPIKGAQLLVSANCLNCHAGMPPTTQPTLATTLASGWQKGCVADSAETRGAAPDFAFTALEREALRDFAARGLGSLKQDTQIEFAERQLTNLRCNACHPRDGQLSTWTQLENEMAPLTAAVPQEQGEGAPTGGTWAPLLTWTGEKLHPDWAENFIAGKIPYKPRPWLIARMPGFPQAGLGLAPGLSHEHGFPITTAQPDKVETPILEAGATLVSENGGFNCTTCHGLGDRRATAVFEAPGINLAYSRERLRKHYYDRWVLYPQRIDPETKMPRFSDDENKTPLGEFFEGKAEPQFDAIWHFLGTVEKPQRAE